MQTREARTGAGAIELETIDVPLVLASAAGVVQRATPAAVELMHRLSMCSGVSRSLPKDLWQTLEAAALGEAVEWRPPQHPQFLLGCSRYAAKAGFFILMREVSDKLAALSRRFWHHHSGAIERLVASMAHELRSSVASILYGADFLELAGRDLSEDIRQQALKELTLASRRLQLSVDSVLGHAHLGPSVSIPVSLTRVLQRVQALMRSLYGDRSPRVRAEVRADAEWVRGNPVTVEQLFAQLLSSAAESQSEPAHVRVCAELEFTPPSSSGGSPRVRVRIWHDGPKAPFQLSGVAFDPFFDPASYATRAELTEMKSSADSRHSGLLEEPLGPDACFTVVFPPNE
jgi:signal transduction histidine kinase